MVVDTKLYDLLGVSPSADERTLKKAFLKKARELHPDKNRDDPHATEKFQAVNEAYEVLKDPEKRARYDQFGPDSLKGDGGDGGFRDDIFSHIFGDFGFGGFGDFGFGGGQRSNRRRRTEDLVYELNVPLEELYSGGDRTVTIQHQRICKKCGGTGTHDGKPKGKCPECGGSGQKATSYKRGNVQYCTTTTCPKCKGTGEFADEKNCCPHCHGKTTIKERKTLNVRITPGMESGEQIKFIGEADEFPDCDVGDVIVVVKEERHPIFKREGSNLLFTKKISFAESILGYKFTVITLDGRTLVIEQHEKITMPDDMITIPEEGMPTDSSGLRKGDLIIRFEILPVKKEDIPKPVIEAMQQFMPPENPEIDEEDPNVFKPTVMPFNPEKYRRKKSHRRSDYHNDEEEQREGCSPM